MLLIALYALWIVLNGRITAEILLIGIPVACLIWLFSIFVAGLSPRKDFARFKKLPRAFLYLCWLWKEVMRSALRVIRLIWSPSRPESVIAEFDPPLRTKTGRVILADSITLTPGTITLDAAEGPLRVHCLERASADTLGADRMTEKVKSLEDSRHA